MRAALALVAVVVLAPAAFAEPRSSAWVRERGIVEWMNAGGGWRIVVGDDRDAPGFQSLSGGTELSLGLTLKGPVGIVLNGRMMVGVERAHGRVQLETLGGLALDVRVSDAVHLRAGPTGGEIRVDDARAVLVGAYLATTIDVVPLGRRTALALLARLDYDALLAPSGPAPLPHHAFALTAGTGLRY
jgi:hypothetical protein